MARRPNPLLASAALRARYEEVARMIERETLVMAEDPRKWRRAGGSSIKAAERRWVSMLDALDDETRRYYETELPKIYQRGAQVGKVGRYALTETDLDLISKMQDQGVNETLFHNAIAKQDAGRMSRMLRQGDPESLKKFVKEEGVRGMRYADGRRMGIDSYANMVLTARARITYNLGTVYGPETRGVTAWSVTDGKECGLTSHEDPEKANGALFTKEECLAFPIAHPFCVRQFFPEPNKKITIPITLGKKKTGIIPGLFGPPALAAAGVGFGVTSVGVLLADANLRRKLTEVALRAEPVFHQFRFAISTILKAVQRGELADVIPIGVVTDRDLINHISTYAEDFGDGVSEFPDYVYDLLNLPQQASRSAIGDAFDSFMTFVDATRTASGEKVRELITIESELAQSVAGSFGRLNLERLTRFTLPHIEGRRAIRLISHPTDWLRVQGTLKDIFDPDIFGKIASGDTLGEIVRGFGPKFIPNIRLNPNGLLRGGFNIINGKIIPNLALIPPGPLRIFTKLNPGGSVTTTFRLLTNRAFNFSMNANVKMDVISQAIKYGLLDWKKWTNPELISAQFNLLRRSVRGQLSAFEWDNFNIRSIAAELRFYGYSIFDVSRVFRIKWQDAITLVKQAEDWFRGAMASARQFYRQRRYGGQILVMPGQTRFSIFADTSPLAEDVFNTAVLKPNAGEVFAVDPVKMANRRFLYEDANRLSHMLQTNFPGAEKFKFALGDLPEGEFAHYEPKEKVLTISRELWNTYTEGDLNDRLQAAVTANWFPAGTNNPASTIVHEIGHHLDMTQSTLQRYRLMQKIRKMPGYIRKEDLSAAERVALASWDDELQYNFKWLSKNLSGYSTMNSWEMMAEGFSEYVTSDNPRALAKVIGQHMEEVWSKPKIFPRLRSLDVPDIVKQSDELLAKYLSDDVAHSVYDEVASFVSQIKEIKDPTLTKLILEEEEIEALTAGNKVAAEIAGKQLKLLEAYQTGLTEFYMEIGKLPDFTDAQVHSILKLFVEAGTKPPVLTPDIAGKFKQALYSEGDPMIALEKFFPEGQVWFKSKIFDKFFDGPGSPIKDYLTQVQSAIFTADEVPTTLASMNLPVEISLKPGSFYIKHNDDWIGKAFAQEVVDLYNSEGIEWVDLPIFVTFDTSTGPFHVLAGDFVPEQIVAQAIVNGGVVKGHQVHLTGLWAEAFEEFFMNDGVLSPRMVAALNAANETGDFGFVELMKIVPENKNWKDLVEEIVDELGAQKHMMFHVLEKKVPGAWPSINPVGWFPNGVEYDKAMEFVKPLILLDKTDLSPNVFEGGIDFTKVFYHDEHVIDSEQLQTLTKEILEEAERASQLGVEIPSAPYAQVFKFGDFYWTNNPKGLIASWLAEVSDDPEIANLVFAEITDLSDQKPLVKLFEEALQEKFIKMEPDKFIGMSKGPSLNETVNHLLDYFRDSWGNFLSKVEREAVTAYTSSGYIPINFLHRSPELIDMEKSVVSGYGFENSMDGLRAASENLESALAKASMPEDTTVWRGMDIQPILGATGKQGGMSQAEVTFLNALDEDEQVEFLRERLVDRPYSDPAFMSTTVDEQFSRTWVGGHNSGMPVIMEMIVPEGSKAAYVPVIGGNYGEREILVQRESKWRIKDIFARGGMIYLRMVME